MGEVNSYRDLQVWQKSMEIVMAIYNETNNFPSNEQYGLVSQLRRAAVSIPAILLKDTEEIVLNLMPGSSK